MRRVSRKLHYSELYESQRDAVDRVIQAYSEGAKVVRLDGGTYTGKSSLAWALMERFRDAYHGEDEPNCVCVSCILEESSYSTLKSTNYRDVENYRSNRERLDAIESYFTIYHGVDTGNLKDTNLLVVDNAQYLHQRILDSLVCYYGRMEGKYLLLITDTGYMLPCSDYLNHLTWWCHFMDWRSEEYDWCVVEMRESLQDAVLGQDCRPLRLLQEDFRMHNINPMENILMRITEGSSLRGTNIGFYWYSELEDTQSFINKRDEWLMVCLRKEDVREWLGQVGEGLYVPYSRTRSIKDYWSLDGKRYDTVILDMDSFMRLESKYELYRMVYTVITRAKYRVVFHGDRTLWNGLYRV